MPTDRAKYSKYQLPLLQSPVGSSPYVKAQFALKGGQAEGNRRLLWLSSTLVENKTAFLVP